MIGAWVGATGCSGGEVECVAGFELGPGDACYAIEDEPTEPPVDDTGTPVVDSSTEPTDTGEAPDPEPEPATIEDLLESLPGCGELTPDPVGAIDLDEGCVGAGCVGMALAELEEVYGPAVCEALSDPGYLLCGWSAGELLTYVADLDLDGVADSDFVTYGLWVGDRFPGATAEGLTAGVGVSCFVDQRGIPSFLEIEEYDGVFFVEQYGWDQGLFYVADYYDALGRTGGDGYVDWLYLNP